MKILLFALPLMLIAVSCNKSKDATTEYKQQKEEVNKDYQEDVKDAGQERSEEMKDAQEDLQEEQKEEAEDYVEDAEGARVNKTKQEVDVVEPAKD